MFDVDPAQFFWYMFLWYLVFIAIGMVLLVFSDILRRDNLSGWGKVGWGLLIVLLPYLGTLLYVLERSKKTE